MNIDSILDSFNINAGSCTITPLRGGLINSTWRIADGDDEYILQRVNDAVFKDPVKIDENISKISAYLEAEHPEYRFIAPLRANAGQTIVQDAAGYFRLFPFVKDSVTIHAVADPEQAREAAAQFGVFTRLLSGFDAATLHTTIPDFHNLSLRHAQFEKARNEGNPDRIRETTEEVGVLEAYKWIVKNFQRIQKSKDFRIRVTHHDTKISNVLFDQQGKGLCVIDLDTVMPGYFISDLGDMVRTYVSPANEEESDYGRIKVRQDVFVSLVQGYLDHMGDELTPSEKKHIHYSGMFMTYMQALRFLTDYLNDDAYYGAGYEGHNRVRATNQIYLLKALDEAESDLLNGISELINI